MAKSTILLFIVVLVTISVFYQSHNFRKSQSSMSNGSTRIVFIPIDIETGSESIIKGKIDELNSFLDANATIQRPIIFVESNEQNKEQMSGQQYDVIEKLLFSIKSNPIFVFGKNFSKDYIFNFAPGDRYGKIAITPDAGPWINIIQVDSNDLFSEDILQFTHRVSDIDIPGLTLYNNHEEPQKQFNWLSSLVGATTSTNIIVTQKELNKIDDQFGNKLLGVVCSSRISLFVYMSEKENLFRKGACPGNSFSMLGATEHLIGFLGLQMHDVQPRRFRCATIDIDQYGAHITYKIL